MRRRFKVGGLGVDGHLALILIIVVALPLVGVYKILTGDENDKATGTILLIVGLIIWIIMVVIGN